MPSNRREYSYTPSYEENVKVVENRSLFDTITKDVKTFRAQEGQNIIRILPPTWKNANHYGLRVKVHFNIGPRNSSYLCLNENDYSPDKGKCPLCKMLYRTSTTVEEKKQYGVGERILYYVINRKEEQAGLQVWTTSGSNASEIASQTINTKKKSIIDIVHPDDGHDIEFTGKAIKIGARNAVECKSFKLEWDASPLSESSKKQDEWLDFVFDNPLPTILNFYSPEHINEVFMGMVAEEEDERPRGRMREEDEDESPRLQRRRAVDNEEDEDKPKPRRTKLQEDLDDEIPFDTKKNGEVDEDEDEDRPIRSRRRAAAEEGEEEDRPKPRRRIGADGDEDEGPSPELKSRLRERLNRERD